jgi:hypothetical protein
MSPYTYKQIRGRQHPTILPIPALPRTSCPSSNGRSVERSSSKRLTFFVSLCR